MVTVQMILELIVFGLAFRAFLGAVQLGRQQRTAQQQAGPRDAGRPKASTLPRRHERWPGPSAYLSKSTIACFAEGSLRPSRLRLVCRLDAAQLRPGGALCMGHCGAGKWGQIEWTNLSGQASSTIRTQPGRVSTTLISRLKHIYSTLLGRDREPCLPDLRSLRSGRDGDRLTTRERLR